MGWVLFSTILFYFFSSYDQRHNYHDPEKGKTIGETVKKGGYYLTNIGDRYDNDNWVMIGKYEPIYWVNVYEKEGIHCIMIENQESDTASESWECEAESETKRIVDMLKKSYLTVGAVMIDERIKEIDRIIAKDPFYKNQPF